MFSKTLFATVLLASSSMIAFSQKAIAPDNIPECSTMCMTTKITEAAAWFGPGDLTSYCTHPQFLVAYNNCLKDHCHGQDLIIGQQAGAAACGTTTSALNSTLPSNGGSPAHGSNATTLPSTTVPSSGNLSLPANSSTNPVNCPTCTPFNSTNNSMSSTSRFSPTNSTNSTAANNAAASPANVLRVESGLGLTVAICSIASVLL